MTHTTWAEYAAENHDPSTHFVCDCCHMVTPRSRMAPGYGPMPGHEGLEQGLCMRCLNDWGRFANRVRIDTVGAACGTPTKASQPGVFDHLEPWLNSDPEMQARVLVAGKKDPERYRERLAAFFHRYAQALAAEQGIPWRGYVSLRQTERHLDELEQQRLSLEAQQRRDDEKADQARQSAQANEERRKAQREALDATHAEIRAKVSELRQGGAR